MRRCGASRRARIPELGFAIDPFLRRFQGCILGLLYLRKSTGDDCAGAFYSFGLIHPNEATAGHIGEDPPLISCSS